MISESDRNFIYDTINRLASPASLSEVAAGFTDAMAKFGFSSLGISGLPPPGEDVNPLVLIESAPKGYRDDYIHERFYAVNHVAAHARATCEPFRFSDAPYTPGDARRHERFMQALESYQIGKGVVVPVGGPANTATCVWLAGKDPAVHDSAILAIQLISLFAASKAHALAGPRHGGVRSSTLTTRERDALAWAARGKSAWEIGEILGISKRTVDEHVQTACRKLNAANRTQAVAAALRDGLIAL
jgi:LuxR family quorum sensing-dependent transcriptional regulator